MSGDKNLQRAHIGKEPHLVHLGDDAVDLAGVNDFAQANSKPAMRSSSSCIDV